MTIRYTGLPLPGPFRWRSRRRQGGTSTIALVFYLVWALLVAAVEAVAWIVRYVRAL